MRERAFLGIGAAVAAALAALEIRSHVPALHAVFAEGDILRTNELSGLSQSVFDETLGHVQLVLLGVSLIALVCAAAAGRRSLSGTRYRALTRVALAHSELLALPLVGLILWAVFRGRCFPSAEGLVSFLDDDAMISMRYAKNLVQGAGLVFNPGERVEGYTNFLWVLVMALIHAVGTPDRYTSFVVIGVSGALLVPIALAQGSALRRLGVGPVFVVACVVVTLFDENTICWVASGLEPIALAALVTGCVWAVLRERRALALAALAVLPLVRSDAFLLAGALGLFLLWMTPAARRLTTLAWLGAATAPTIAHEAFRIGYYGHPFPNTYYLKMLDLSDRLGIGAGGYGARVLVRYPGIALLMGIGAFSGRWQRAARGLVLLVAMPVAYGIFVGGDTFLYLRFVAPVLPVAYVVAAYGAAEFSRGLAPYRRNAVAALMLAACPAFSPVGPLGELVDISPLPRGLYGVSRLFAANLPKDTTVTVYPAGTLPYFAMDERFIDVLGKNDEHIAHLDHYDGLVIGHNKFDFDYVYSRRPDVSFVFDRCAHVDFLVHATPEQRAGFFELTNPLIFRVYVAEGANARFARQYYPNQIRFVGVDGPPECLFLRDDSNLSLFWTKNGPLRPPPTLEVRFDRQPPSPFASFNGGWSPPRRVDGSRTVRRVGDDGVASLDVGVVPGSKRLELCLARGEPFDLDVRANGARLPPAAPGPAPGCDGDGFLVDVPREIVARDRHLLRLDLERRPGGRSADLLGVTLRSVAR